MKHIPLKAPAGQGRWTYLWGRAGDTTRAQGDPWCSLEATRVRVRELPGAVGLGLLASVLGHMAAYGNGHAMGGPYHDLLITLVDAGVGSFVFAALALAWVGSGRISDGSVLAARLATYLPSVPLLALSAAGWYQFFESVEGAHAGYGTAVIVIALSFAILLVHWLARSAIAVIAALILSIFRNPFAPRVRLWIRYAEHPLPIREGAPLHRRFARPPPCTTASA